MEELEMDAEFMKMRPGRRLDLVLAVLSAMDVQEKGGWTLRGIAELAGVSSEAVRGRETEALRVIRSRTRHLEDEFRK